MKSGLLLSGGMDSIALAYWKRPDFAFTIDYGHRPAPAEIRAAVTVCAQLDIQHEVLSCNASALGSGDLGNSPALPIAPVPEWWPFRNQFLVTVAAMRGVSLGISRLMIGCLRTDGIHADGLPTFVDAMSELLSSQEGAMRLEAPAIHLSASELINESKIPADILAWAHSCHVSEYACGNCRGCRKHYETLATLGESPY